MTKTIKAAQSLTEAFAFVEESLASGNTPIPQSAAGAMAALRKSVNAAADLLLDAGKVEFDSALKDAKAKLKA